MLAEERYQKIEELIQEKGIVKASELTELFGVSLETVRRDLFFLETKGTLRRVHGGAARPQRRTEFRPFGQRREEQSREKRMIAATAASMIREEDIIALDCGTTSLEMAPILKERFRRLTILTHSMAIFNVLADAPGMEIILPGGVYQRDEYALCGPLAEEFIHRFHVGKAFLCPAALSLENGFSDYRMELVAAQNAYIKIADQAIFLADSSKFETSALIRAHAMEEGHIVITDSNLSDELYERYTQNAIHVIRGDKDEKTVID